MIVAGRRLEIATFGDGGRRAPIVLLHEGLGSVSQWRDFPLGLAEATGRRVVAYSRYGHGRSDVLRDPRAVEYMHHEGEIVLPALLAELAIDRAILFGHSDGASIALIFAARFPHACEALILEAPHVFVEPLTVESIARIRDVALQTDLLTKLERHHNDARRTFWGWNDIWLDPAFRSWDITARLAAISAPILTLQGNDDEYGTAAQITAIAEYVARVETLFIDNCGHAPHRDAVDAVLAATARFLAHRP